LVSGVDWLRHPATTAIASTVREAADRIGSILSAQVATETQRYAAVEMAGMIANGRRASIAVLAGGRG
jgi:hypothetical protein